MVPMRAANIIGLYLNPPLHAVVFFVQIAIQSLELARHLCCAFPWAATNCTVRILSGPHVIRCTQLETRADFAGS